jgi:hypothetical protein
MEELPEVVVLLRAEARRGCRPSELLRLLAARPGGTYTSSLVFAFRAAFGVPPEALTLIGGWSPKGGEITDARIDDELGPLVAIAVATPGRSAQAEPGHVS